MADDTQPLSAAYVPWGTFKNSLAAFSEGLPNRIDRTALVGMAGGTQAHLLSALKFLGLIEDDGTPTSAMAELAVPDEETRKKVLDRIVRERYSALFELDLTKATPAQLQEKMQEHYRVRGTTRDRAVRFFLGAAEYLDIPLSQYFSARGSAGATNSSPRRKSRKPKGKQQVDRGGEDDNPPKGGSSKTVRLASGGSLELIASVDVMTMSEADRKFLFELIDKMEAYGKADDELE